ncbi:unnamed protein product [Oppiella nova]|uniref:Secreted protein n=1 Tax=Oppiella nova TaxID=334625 RepID=A0A7R9LG58_9ACAR|nr:unnamed protein product [Oppiella nova]CAG2162869.1 unnamed protein product [Oppiella nova]
MNVDILVTRFAAFAAILLVLVHMCGQTCEVSPTTIALTLADRNQWLGLVGLLAQSTHRAMASKQWVNDLKRKNSTK